MKQSSTVTRPRLADGGGYRPCDGSKEHPHIKHPQLKPWLTSTLLHHATLLRAKDQGARALARECESTLSLLYVRPQTIRNGSPKERAHAIIANVYAQQSAHRTGVFKQYKKMPVGLVLVIHALATEVCIRHSGLKPTDRPRWRWVQLARSVYHLLKADVSEYARDDGHGNVRTVKVRHRAVLRSWNVAKQIALTLEPVYRMDFHQHHAAIATRCLHTMASASMKNHQ